ncbi:MAG: hypothetical protein AAF565_06115 [Pseudomonadota bacterium]
MFTLVFYERRLEQGPILEAAGLSHDEAEEMTPEWAGKGANVLLQAALEGAEVVR